MDSPFWSAKRLLFSRQQIGGFVSGFAAEATSIPVRPSGARLRLRGEVSMAEDRLTEQTVAEKSMYCSERIKS